MKLYVVMDLYNGELDQTFTDPQEAHRQAIRVITELVENEEVFNRGSVSIIETANRTGYTYNDENGNDMEYVAVFTSWMNP